jgi:hypothetical protein
VSARERRHRRPFAVVRLNCFFERKVVSTHRTAGAAETVARILEAAPRSWWEWSEGTLRFYVAPPGLRP